MATRIPKISFDRPIVDDSGSLTTQSRGYFKALTDLAMVIGTGSPEGVIEAVQGALYMDDTGTAGNILYVKRDNDISGDKTKGWI